MREYVQLLKSFPLGDKFSNDYFCLNTFLYFPNFPFSSMNNYNKRLSKKRRMWSLRRTHEQFLVSHSQSLSTGLRVPCRRLLYRWTLTATLVRVSPTPENYMSLSKRIQKLPLTWPTQSAGGRAQPPSDPRRCNNRLVSIRPNGCAFHCSQAWMNILLRSPGHFMIFLEWKLRMGETPCQKHQISRSNWKLTRHNWVTEKHVKNHH